MRSLLTSLTTALGAALGAAALVFACGGFDADADGFYTDPLLCGGALFDCDDSNRAVGHGAIYFLDCDGDSLGDPENPAYLCDETLCGSEDGRVRGCNISSNGLDCNDRAGEGAAFGAGVPLYPDCDADGLGDPSQHYLYCQNSTLDAPTTLGNCPMVLNADDCDDNPSSINNATLKSTLWWDCDDDGDGDDEVGPMLLCPAAEGLPRIPGLRECTLVSQGGDCDDTDPTLNSASGC